MVLHKKQGKITCISKQNKSWINFKNWRPISLLNVIYKLASAVISNRLKKVLDNVINENQNGFIAGRLLLVYCTSNRTQFFVFKILHEGFFT